MKGHFCKSRWALGTGATIFVAVVAAAFVCKSAGNFLTLRPSAFHVSIDFYDIQYFMEGHTRFQGLHTLSGTLTTYT